MAKKRLEIRINEDMRAALDIEVQHSGKSLTAVVEDYIRIGLARSQGKIIEAESLPAIHNAIHDEMNLVIGQLYHQLSTDIMKITKRDTERLAKLIVNSWRDSGVAWRLAYSLISHSVGSLKAREWYEDAKAKAGKAIGGNSDSQG